MNSEFAIKHKLLTRQLKSCGIDIANISPEWQKLLEHVDHTYSEADQDRYLIERSQEISSREMQDLYNHLEQSQQVGHIGSFTMYGKDKKRIWSAETFRIFGLEPAVFGPSEEKFYQLIHVQDRPRVKECIENSLREGVGYDIEYRCNVGDAIRWVHVITQAVKSERADGGYNLIGVTIDVTLQKNTEMRQLMEQNIERILTNSQSLDDVVSDIIQIICNTIEFDCGVCLAQNGDLKTLLCTVIWGEQPTEFANFIQESIESKKIQQELMMTVAPVWLSANAEKLRATDYARYFMQKKLAALYILPITANKAVSNILLFYSHKQQKLDMLTLQAIHSVGTRINLFVERIQAQNKLIELNQEFVATARRAGMADVATSVLHNVGNVLNSINVSVNLLMERIQRSRLDGLNQVAELLQKSVDKKEPVFGEDEQGKKLSEYLVQLADYWKSERTTALTEFALLHKNVEHVKDIIAMQQSFSGTAGVIEPVALTDLVEAALKINSPSLEKFHVSVKRDYAKLPQVLIDRVKLQQILVNLISNANDALKSEADNAQDEKQLTLSVKLNAEQKIEIKVADNGCGILTENAERIFSHGFTTKPSGHGYGLHNSALYAKEMRGSLTAFSEGMGKGSVFTLEIPYTPAG